MKIDLKKIKAMGGKVIEYDASKKYMIVFNSHAVTIEEAEQTLQHFHQAFGLIVEGDTDSAVSLFEIKNPDERKRN